MRISDWSSDVCSSDLAALLYQAIDGSGGYYRNPIEPSARSRMNVRFTLHDSALDATFLQGSEAAGLLSLKGHKALEIGRASCRDRVCKYVENSVVAVSLKKKQKRRRIKNLPIC